MDMAMDKFLALGVFVLTEMVIYWLPIDEIIAYKYFIQTEASNTSLVQKEQVMVNLICQPVFPQIHKTE
jgi:hypothetical protein